MPSESATAAAAATSAPAPAADTVRTASPAPGSRPGTPARTPAGGQPGAQAGAAAGGAAAAALSSKVVAKASLSDLLAAAAFGTSTTSARRTELKEACAKALQSLDAMPPDSIEARRLVFHALNLACDLRLHAGVPIAVDCLGKLFAYGFWSSPKPKRDPRPAGAADQRLPVVRRRQSLVSVATSEATGLGDDIYNEDDDEIDPDDDGYAYGAEDDASGRGFSADGTAPNTSEEGGAAPSVDSAPEGGGIFGRPPAKQPLAYMAVDAICKAYAVPSLTDEATQLQIVKAITSAITSDYPASAIHGKMLLKTVRAIYNLFLSGKTVNVQTVAQASLIQITQAVFSRVPLNVDGPKLVRAHLERIGADLPAAAGEQSAESSSSVQTASQSAETEQNGDRHEPAVDEIDPTLAESLDSIAPARDSTDRATEASSTLASMGERDTLARTSLDIIGSNPSAPVVSSEDDFDLRIKDAYLVFRALCKLAMKPIPGADGVADIRSSAMRSKMLSLHLVNMVLTSFSSVFFVPAPILFSIVRYPQSMQSVGFVMAVKQYICLVFTRNITNIVPQVFEITTRIFGRILLDLRTALKKEISVMFTQVILPFMEPKPGAATATFHQRFILLQTLHAVLSAEPSASGRMIVELYLNYDCDVSATAHENIWERLVVALAKSVTAPFDPSQHSDRPMSTLLPASSTTVMTAALGVPLSSANMPSVAQANLVPFTRDQIRDLYSSSGDQTELRLRALQLLVQGILMPLIAWYNERTTAIEAAATAEQASERQPAEDAGQRLALSASGAGLTEPVLRPGVLGQDDPAAFQNLKNRKQLMLEGIKRFNQKPKKGVQLLLDSGCIPSRTPRDIARFLLDTEGLSKAMIGEFLGEGEEENIAIMHAFVDEMDFVGHGFVDALRHFLQSFRLPGEAQKIDRFMLKFAERYLKGNPKAFSSADTAYVLAYSVIMLNTDQHNAQVKRRMTKEDFLKNNRGIDEGKDLPAEFLGAIFDEIQSNEIVMKDEAKAKPTRGGDAQADTRRAQKDKLTVTQAGEQITQKTEAMFSTLLRGAGDTDGQQAQQNMLSAAQPGINGRLASESSPRPGATARPAGARDGGATIDGDGMQHMFYSATHYEHVRPMFQLVWMSLLMSVSTPLQQSDNLDMIMTSLEGFKHLMHLACLFDLELEKRAFLSGLAKFTALLSVSEVRTKNLEAAKTLLEIAVADGNHLDEHWVMVVKCVSQLEKLQLLTKEDAEAQARVSSDGRRDAQARANNKPLVEDAAAAAQLASQGMTLLVDRIFTASAKLSGAAIVHFVRALCEMSWEEIKSSMDREHPRMYCLQRLVEISYYNMKRIRVEWSNIWAILGQHFNQVGCLSNTNVVYFALDKLRQLAMKFLDIVELPNFKFQKDFLRPFEIILVNNPDVKIKDMVLACLQQMVKARAEQLRSGWKAMFSTFGKAAREEYEPIVVLAFEIVRTIFKTHFDHVLRSHHFGDFVNCLVEFCKNQRFPKTCLQSVELLHHAIAFIEKRLDTLSPSHLSYAHGENIGDVVEQAMQVLSVPIATKPEMQLPTEQEALDENPSIRFWFPVLFGLYEIVMTCDLEVRTRALNFLFDALDEHGSTFTQDFWSLIHKGVLFPIFDDLRLTRKDYSKFGNKEEMSVWLSTTLIQALRKFVELFSSHFDALLFLMDDVLDLLMVCMTQENESLSKIGSTCLQQLIEANVDKLTEPLWDKICDRLVYLFETTSPDELFFEVHAETGADVAARESVDGGSRASQAEPADEASEGRPSALGFTPSAANRGESAVEQHADSVPGARRLAPTGKPFAPRPQKSDFQRIIVKCVLHLQVIQTLQELLSSENSAVVYNSLPSRHVLALVDCLFQSYQFAQKFNADVELRTALFQMGFMRQPPNLLKQETASVSGYLLILLRMYCDHAEKRVSSQDEVERRLIPLALEILTYYNTLDPESRKRNLGAWRPVVHIIVTGVGQFDDAQFGKHIWALYLPVAGLIQFELAAETRMVVRSILMRAAGVFGVQARLDAAAAAARSLQPAHDADHGDAPTQAPASQAAAAAQAAETTTTAEKTAR